MAFQKIVGQDFETPPGSRANSALVARGFLTENFPINQTDSTGATATNQTTYLALVGVKPGDVITNIHVAFQTAAITASLAQYALVDRLGNRLATTTDNAGARTATESTGIKTTPLTAPYTIGSGTDGVYVAFLGNAGTAGKLAVAGAGNAAQAGGSLTGKFQAAGTAGTGLSSIATTSTVAATSALNFWAALS